MKIPIVLENKYRTEHKLNSFVSTAIARIEGHLRANPMVFFPEYTDHGISHVESTLQTTVDLATSEAQNLMTAADCVAIAVAVGLHDLGMYLTRDGFESLIREDSGWKGIEFFDKEPWRDLWEDFYSEATRFDDRKLKNMFGNNYRPVRPLPTRDEPWEEFDFLLVGEFLRLHHPRLAHEIALHGLPGKDGGALPICPTDTAENRFLADVCGLVARSHGLDLRICMAYLDNEYRNKIDPRGIHPIFLGVLLRISDYFQIQATRAPTERTEVTSFKSGFSDCEWQVHQSVTDIHNSGDDPEAIVIEAGPPNVEIFLRLKKWLIGIQNELDRSWAILGEVFALQTHIQLDKFGLKIRRVKSNLDDVEAFSKTVSYIPAKIAFEAANADLLKLLVAPLYGSDPEFGIRELFQNSIDAVREFDDLVLLHPEIERIERYPQSSDVLLEIQTNTENKPTEIIVTDRGVGMTPDVVREYFLRAGASFRKSNSWRQDHEDLSGHSRVLRTGRFGVGALAAFLLGDEIEVTTRHVQAKNNEGITFTARLDDESISLLRTTVPAGTRIRIKVPERLQGSVDLLLPGSWAKELQFSSPIGHYFLQRPSVKRVIGGIESKLLPVAWLPQPEDGNSVVWRCFSTEEFEKIFWTYETDYPSLTSNGIVISADPIRINFPGDLRAPKISLFDKDGYLPVNLQRTDLQSRELPFTSELARSVTTDLVAHAAVEGPPIGENPWFDGSYPGFEHSGYSYDNDHWANWLISKDGFVLNKRILIEKFAPEFLVIGIGGARGYVGWGDRLRNSLPNKTLLMSYLPNSLADFNPRVKGLFQSTMTGRVRMWSVRYAAIQAFIPNALVDKVKSMRPGRGVLEELQYIANRPSKKGWRYFSFELPGNVSLPLGLAASLVKEITSIKVDAKNPIMFIVIKPIAWQENENNDDPVGIQWLRDWDGPLVPFNLSKRKNLEGNASSLATEFIQIRRKKLKSDKKSPTVE
jgi:molecular chaperone HtpG